jgi:hypothetical protein
MVSPVIKDAAGEARNTTRRPLPWACRHGAARRCVLLCRHEMPRRRARSPCPVRMKVGATPLTVLAPFHCQTFGEMGDSRFGHAINRFGRQRGKASLRAHVDDGAALLADHQLSRGLTDKKCALQVHGQCRVEAVLRYILSQIFGCNSPVCRCDRSASQFRARRWRSAPSCACPSAAVALFYPAFVSPRLIPSPPVHGANLAPGPHRHAPGQRNRPSQASCRSGYQRDSPTQAKLRVLHYLPLSLTHYSHACLLGVRV